METNGNIPNLLQKIFLSCGIVAPLVYLATDLLTGKHIKGYSFSAQSMSDLGATGSPMRQLFVALSLVACVFLLAFGIGVWHSAGSEVLPRIISALLFGNVLAGLVATLLFPNNYGVRPSFFSRGVLLMFFSVLCSVLAVILGAIAYHGWMRIISIAIPSAFILLAILRFATAGGSPGPTTTLIGSQERTMAYSFMLWTMALALNLLI